MSQAAADEKAKRFEQKNPLARLNWPARIGLIVGFVLLASVGYLKSSLWQIDDSSKTSSDGMDSSEIEERKPVGEFDLIEADGKKVSIQDYRGKVVILSFWASWCTPCLVELPTFAQIEKKFGDRGFAVVPVNVDDGDVGKNFAKEFWSKNGFEFPSFYDTQKELAEKFEVDILPSNFVIDRQGRIVFSGFGATDWTAPETAEIIEGLVNEK